MNTRIIWLLVIFVLTGNVTAEWYFRGTPNAWGATQMTTDDNVHYCTTQTFSGGDENGGPRFKVDRYGNWQESYPAQDYSVNPNTQYTICLNIQSHVFSLEAASPNDLVIHRLGAEYDADGTTFAVWSPESQDVVLNLNGVNYQMLRADDQNGYTGIYGLRVDGDLHGQPYFFKINGSRVRDPYGKMAIPNEDTNIVMDMSRTLPVGGWAERPPLAEREDAIIYEIHVRDFTIDTSSGVSADKRGKFLGMVEPGTVYQSVATGVDHLKELGITHVQLLPIYDFATCPDLADTSCYNWGYDPRNYNVPEDRYAVSLNYEDRVRELKTMVNEFHKAGIRVIMDVVYNHTFDYEMFENISMRYYTDTDLSGTGNSIDANVPMVSRMIQDSLEYWLTEYNLDGFRFDLAGIFDHDEFGAWGRHLNDVFPDRKLLLYGEPWNGYAYDVRENERVRPGTIAREYDAHVGIFNAHFREAIKGNNDDGYGGGFAFNQGEAWKMDFGSRAAIRYNNDPWQVIDLWDPMFATDPEQTINYVSAHDNLCLRDKILAWADVYAVDPASDYLRRIQNYANGMILTSQGIPFLHGGVELMRDKQGDENSFISSDEINKIRWNWKVENADIYRYYQDLIRLRNHHPGLRMNTWNEIDSYVSTIRYSDQVLVTDINAAANNDDWSRILVIYNSGGDFSYPLPAGTWYVAVERNDPDAGNDRMVTNHLWIEGTAVTVLYQP
ncbi:alpha-amylase family glycosyl hydrolase [Gynuella sunshinyii]|uniref:Type II secretory pathway, pullulanase PulA and related glycosidase n=1 Tax=Gynuella sunshinyii YC6258 TaxID=1445510 RepID=A0A0C5VU86_9GAMM|nr:alpha-amylase family glycosyl hydrolase [Gynuella sunshinyii]AJQ96873.1 type II secretory pathway, pullulanase PulA and related glycosidase [Gynuella sunshinyii YC6258]